MRSSNRAGILLAVLAAALYALNAPLSKLLLAHIPATLMAGLLYVGAGIGMGVVALVRYAAGRTKALGHAAVGLRRPLPPSPFGAPICRMCS